MLTLQCFSLTTSHWSLATVFNRRKNYEKKFLFLCVNGLMLLGFSSTVVSQFGDPVPRYPQEMDGPVNVINRALVFSETDIAVPGRGLGIDFTRYYNADGLKRYEHYPSYMGYKWSHSYQWELLLRGSRPKVIRGKAVRNTFTVTVVTGAGSDHTFTTSGSNLGKSGWESRIKFHTKTGVHASMKLVQSGTKWAYVYTTRSGISYRFEQPVNIDTRRYVLTKISDPNGNSITLHYEAGPETSTSQYTYPRLVAVEDTQGRILKFYYGVEIDDVAYPRHISKVEFGLGTPQTLTSVYQTLNYTYSRYRRGDWRRYYYYNCLMSAAQPIGTGDPRGSELKTQYEYSRSSEYSYRSFALLNAVVLPLGYRTEFTIIAGGVNRIRVRDVAPNDNTEGAVLYHRYYGGWGTWQQGAHHPATYGYNTTYPQNSSNRRHYRLFQTFRGNVTEKYSYYKKPGSTRWSSFFTARWNYSGRNPIMAYHRDTGNKLRWHYRIHYTGPNAAHNILMGNPTKWEEIGHRRRLPLYHCPPQMGGGLRDDVQPPHLADRPHGPQNDVHLRHEGQSHRTAE